jgi:hypothetical protein
MPRSTAFAVSVSADRHYLVDQRGQPFLLVGDSSWDIATSISPADQALYVSTRASQGFNTLLVSAIAGKYDNARSNWSTFDGIVPFYKSDGVTLGTGPSDYDITKPNPAYWARVDSVVQLAQTYGMTVLLNPMPAGMTLIDNPSFLSGQGVARSTAYGTWIATRYKNYPNLQWHWGVDYWTSNWAAGYPYLVPMANAVRAVLPNSLQTIELNDGTSQDLSTDNPNWSRTVHDSTHAQVDMNWMYDYRPNSPDISRAYNLSSPIPVFHGEGVYEHTSKYGQTGNPPTLRAYLYNPLLNGGFGQFYGENTVWYNGPGWKTLMTTTGVTEIGYYKILATSLPWWMLIPDQTHAFATAGYTSAAVTADGSWGLAYLATHMSTVINMTKMRATVTARWYDPTNGHYTPIGNYPNTGTHTFTPPATNSTAGTDWILVLNS